MADVGIFLRLDGIPGDSTDARHADEIVVTAFSWGLASAGGLPATGTGAGAGKVTFDGLTVVARSSRASPLLMQTCAQGRHIPSGVLSVQRAAEKPVDVMVVRMSDLLVGAYSVGAGGGEGAEDEITLTFGRIEYDVFDGKQHSTATWDLRKGTA
jgi:type VI secretion system secreted protein Hcp